MARLAVSAVCALAAGFALALAQAGHQTAAYVVDAVVVGCVSVVLVSIARGRRG